MDFPEMLMRLGGQFVDQPPVSQRHPEGWRDPLGICNSKHRLPVEATGGDGGAQALITVSRGANAEATGNEICRR